MDRDNLSSFIKCGLAVLVALGLYLMLFYFRNHSPALGIMQIVVLAITPAAAFAGVYWQSHRADKRAATQREEFKREKAIILKNMLQRKLSIINEAFGMGVNNNTIANVEMFGESCHLLTYNKISGAYWVDDPQMLVGIPENAQNLLWECTDLYRKIEGWARNFSEIGSREEAEAWLEMWLDDWEPFGCKSAAIINDLQETREKTGDAVKLLEEFVGSE